MKLAVLSDTHDNIWTLDHAMPHLREADAVLHCGDIVAPFVVKRIADAVIQTPVHFVWGNCDGEKEGIQKIADNMEHIKVHGVKAFLDLEGIAVAATHYPHMAMELARSAQYGLVCFGHTHIPHEEWVGDCLLLNPGEILGLKGRSTLAMVTLPQRSVDWIELPYR